MEQAAAPATAVRHGEPEERKKKQFVCQLLPLFPPLILSYPYPSTL